MLYIPGYIETDPLKKDAQWADKLITYFRQYWRPLVDNKASRENMALLLSQIDMDEVKQMFKNPDKIGFKLIPIAVLEKIRNVLIGEGINAGISVNVNALDPTAQKEREGDKQLLRNRRMIESLMTALYKSMGMPEYRLSQEKDQGKNPFRGNVEAFDEMGLDDSSEYQLAYFFTTWHKLLHEMDAQYLVNYFMEFNEVKNNIPLWINDILAKKAIALQGYVDETSGARISKYLAPESTYCIPGKRDDGKDAICVGYEETITISEVIKRLGSEFDFMYDYEYLILAVNYAHTTEYTGIWDGRDMIYGFRDPNRGDVCHIDEFLQFKIQLGYIEWKSWDVDAFKMGIDYHGNLMAYRTSPGRGENPGSKYSTEVIYNQYTYKSYYLLLSSNTQKLFKFGRMYHQPVEGSEDEYSGFSILFKIEPGPTLVDVAKPWISLAQEAFTKTRWMIRSAKPRGRDWNLDSLMEAGKRVIGSDDARTNIMGVIKMFDEGVNEFHTTPKVNGTAVGGGNNPNSDKENGLDPSTKDFMGIIDWAVEKIKNDVGWSDIRDAASFRPNDGLKLQMQSLKSSQNATRYIGNMIDSTMMYDAVRTVAYVQDAIRYKDSLAHKFILSVIGEDGMRRMEMLDHVSLHRYGIVMNGYSAFKERQKLEAEVEQAWVNKEISYESKLLIASIDDPKKAAYILAFEKIREQKQKEQELQQAHRYTLAQQKAKDDAKLQQINAEGQWNVKKEDVSGQWDYKVKQLDVAGRKEIKDSQQSHEQEKTDIRSDAKIREAAAKKSLDSQEPLPA